MTDILRINIQDPDSYGNGGRPCIMGNIQIEFNQVCLIFPKIYIHERQSAGADVHQSDRMVQEVNGQGIIWFEFISKGISIVGRIKRDVLAMDFLFFPEQILPSC